ncbi:hypothetical protein ACIREE_03685 [Streptomyces sp. NPDC102467]|uniref:hypothetical protein n=1 Tax=Streptomyces sp. NPDC102467 TaxID=3366179 RepID=UPI00381BC1BD
MLIIVAMVLGAVSMVCIGVTARQCTTDDITIGPPIVALVTAFTSVALMLTATAYGH